MGVSDSAASIVQGEHFFLALIPTWTRLNHSSPHFTREAGRVGLELNPRRSTHGLPEASACVWHTFQEGNSDMG